MSVGPLCPSFLPSAVSHMHGPPPSTNPISCQSALPTKYKLWESTDPQGGLPLSPLIHREASLPSIIQSFPYHWNDSSSSFFFLSLSRPFPRPSSRAGLFLSEGLEGPGVLHERTFPPFILPERKRNACMDSVLIHLCFCALDQKIKTKDYSRCCGFPAQVPLARKVTLWVLTTVTSTASPEKCPPGSGVQSREGCVPSTPPCCSH